MPVHFYLDNLDADRPSVTAIAEVEEGWVAVLRWELLEGRLELSSLAIGDASLPLPIGNPLPVGDLLKLDPFGRNPEGMAAGAYATTFSYDTVREAGARKGPVTVRLLRSLPIGRLERWAREHIAKTNSISETVGADLSGAARKRPGRRGRGDRFYAEVAAVYVDALAKGNLRPVERTAEALHLSPSQVRNLLSVARDRKLLTRSRRGVAGGELTERGRHVLAGQEVI